MTPENAKSITWAFALLLAVLFFLGWLLWGLKAGAAVVLAAVAVILCLAIAGALMGAE